MTDFIFTANFGNAALILLNLLYFLPLEIFTEISVLPKPTIFELLYFCHVNCSF